MRQILFTLFAALLLGGCSSFKGAVLGDDLYSAHDRAEIEQQQVARAERLRAEAAARQALWDSKVAEARVLAAESDLSDLNTSLYTNPYDAVLADDYQSAYARRLYGFSSPSYKMPSSYYTYRYTDAYHYATAYDPAYYNIMVSGDQVWVEPKSITSMFGSWGAAVVVPTYSWYYGWMTPSYTSWWYGYPRYSWYDWGYGSIYNPYYGWSWGFGWGGYPYHPGFVPPYHHHHYYPPHYGGGSHAHRPNVVVRPNSSQVGGRPSYIGGGSQQSVGGGSGRTQYRGQSGTVTGSGQYRGSSGSRGTSNSQYRDSNTRTNSYNNNNSYRSNSSSSSSGRGYSGGYSGGGNYSGGSHGGGQIRR